MTTRCLEILQRIGDGCDPRASARDRMHAAELRERHLAPPNPEPPWEQEMLSWTEEQLDRELLGLLGVDYDSL